MLWRSLIGVVVAGFLFLRSRPTLPEPAVIRLHVLRGLILAIMAFLFFWGLKFLPVAEAVGLTFIAPLFALYLARVLLKETIGRRAVIASLIGLLGAGVIITGRFSGQYDEETSKGIIAVLASALLYAYNLILQRQQALVARPAEIAFFQNCVLLALFGSLAPFFGEIPAPVFLSPLVAAAVLSIASLQMMSWAYARAPANILLPVEYTAFVWAAILGWLVFDETVTPTTILGTILIVAACLVSARNWSSHEDDSAVA
jgi:S-adenosylmethionine uptake transporter